MFYEHIDRAVENLRQRMMIRSVTMRCKDFDVALPIIDAMEGHVLVGAAPTPRKPLTDEEIAKCNEKVPVLRHITLGYLIKFARAIEAAHGITGDSK
jgi:hypothetical protein